MKLERSEKAYYIPHLAVIHREASTTKLRVVYDASAKSGKGGTSLNDCLHKGPSLNPLLFDILLRFREKRVALIGDIEKAFLNIEVDKGDRDFFPDFCGSKTCATPPAKFLCIVFAAWFSV